MKSSKSSKRSTRNMIKPEKLNLNSLKITKLKNHQQLMNKKQNLLVRNWSRQNINNLVKTKIDTNDNKSTSKNSSRKKIIRRR